MSPLQSHNKKSVLLVGIGGSNLGAKAVYEALRKTDTPLLLCADTVDSVTREWIVAQIDENTELIYVSKSGTTLESQLNFDYFKKYTDNITVITDPDSPVCGRFSVFTKFGIKPLSRLGFDTDAFLEGKADASESEAKKSAQWLFEQLQAGMVAHDMFIFNPELESLGKWYRQLMGESTGKNGKGYLPTVSIGSTDLHSMFQRYIGGPHNIATTFVCVGEPDVFYKATTRTYREHGLPFQEYVIAKRDEFSLGKFMQFKMYEIIELAHLMGVNPFDQPMVELYKEEARRLLV